MRNNFFLKNPIYLILLSTAISTILIIILYGTMKLEDKFEEKMLEISTADVISISNNNAKYIESILKNSNSFSEYIIKNPDIQKDIEQNLEILLTKNIKYAFLVYRDNKGVFRFLADASKPVEKAFVNQKFDVESKKWLDIFELKEALIIKQSIINQLSITYLTPIFNKDRVEVILAVDFAVEKVEDINLIIELMKKAILSIIAIIFIFLIILIIQSIRYMTIKRAVYLDKLTNVYNRNYLQESQDFINLNDFILAALDIDHFKKVNDTYGHDAGDKVLKEVAKKISESTRDKEDIVVRYGGEEFLILIRTKRTNHLSALNVLERIFNNIQENKFYISQKDFINITVSIGVNLVPDKSRTFSDAFKLADIALYNAKNKGRNSIEIYNENSENKDTSLMTINEIKNAIDEHRVICHFQKIVDTNSNDTSHYEALLRIIDLDGNIVTPDKILPVIKGTFISRNITKEVLNISYLELLKNENILINVNLNPQDIINETILNILKNYAQKDNISNRLGLEIVESEDIINYKDAKENLLMLKDLGYKLYIDDFGSGYSNFIYLTEIQSDYIKIDGNIIKKILEDKVSYLVVKSIVDFAKEADIKVIAEYVSDKDIYEKVKSLDIEYCQGFYFSKPSPLV